MSSSKRIFPATYEVMDYFRAYKSDSKYVIDQFEYGHVTDPYDAVDLIDGLLLRIKDLAENDFIEERIEKVKNVYFQLGKFADNIVWNYEVHRYYHPTEIVDFIKEIENIMDNIYEVNKD